LSAGTGQAETHRASDLGRSRLGRLCGRRTILLLLLKIELGPLKLGRQSMNALLEQRLFLGELGRRGGVSGVDLQFCEGDTVSSLVSSVLRTGNAVETRRTVIEALELALLRLAHLL